MKKIITDPMSMKESIDFINDSDAHFVDYLNKGLQTILGGGSVKIITLSGPSCSGKTTTAHFITDLLVSQGKHVIPISLDNFFFERSLLIERSKREGKELDFDSPQTIDLETLSETINQIFSDGDVYTPIFDFESGKREEKIYLGKGSRENVYLLEGIQAVYPSVLDLLNGRPFHSVFISVEEDAFYDNVIFKKDEIRFLRRLVRDNKFRGAEPEFTFSLWKNVRSNEEKNIYPNSKKSDIILSSYLDYELNVVKGDAEFLLSKIRESSPFFLQAQSLLNRLSGVTCFSPDWLGPKSLFKEFVG